MDNTKNIRVLSLCAGYGGLELGISAALERPLRVVAVEIEAYALANLVSKTEEGKLAIEALYPDLRTFPAERFSGCFDIITAGYPCQPFSHAGKRQGTSDPRHLWPHIERIIQAVRPVWCFFENVSGHLTIGFPEVYRSLRLMGYSVEAGLFTAAEVGAPHKRERLFILAESLGTTIGNINGQIEGGARQEDVRQGNREAGSIRIRTASELAHSDSQQGRTHTKGRDNEAETRSGSEKLADSNGSGCKEQCGPESIRQELLSAECRGNRWPARPGQPQHEWEEPRTVKSGVGRAVDGAKSRVDRLRLLGNGVVPACAEKAFRYLMKETVK